MDNKQTDNQQTTQEPESPTVEELLGAYIDKPEKVPFYLAGYQKMNQAGVFGFKWHFSWWAFFFGWAFMLYRKAYVPALVTFFVSIMLGMIPFAFILIMIATGGISTYFVLNRFHNFQQFIKGTKAEQLAAMKNFGGYNAWVVWVTVIFNGLLLSMILLGILSAAMNG